MKETIALLLVILLPAVLVAQVNQNRSLVFNHVTIIGVKDGRLKSDMTVIVTGSRIETIGKTGKVRASKGAEIIDAKGKFLIPGLWDMHVHSLTDNRYEWIFPMLIANGVTGIRELGNNLPFERINQIRREISEGKLMAPRFGAATARILDGAETRLNVAVAVRTGDEARKFVKDYKQQGIDFIKPYNLLLREVYLAIADEAKRQKIPVAGHVPFSMTAREVSDLGQISIEHNSDVLVSCSRDEYRLRQELAEQLKTSPENARAQTELKAAATYNERKAAGLFMRFVRNGTWLCPTLIVTRHTSLSAEEENQFTNDDRMKYIPLPIRERWHREFTQRLAFIANIEDKRMLYRTRFKVTDAAQQTGVQILAGTDTPNPYVFPGFGLHEELELLVQSGFSPLEALQTATVNPARFFGKETTLGTIEKGKLADLVLLDANPLKDIKNTTRIAAVVAGGKFFPKLELEKLLAQAERFAKK